jgi:hypothetical protein
MTSADPGLDYWQPRLIELVAFRTSFAAEWSPPAA